jgi:hypothetical protein
VVHIIMNMQIVLRIQIVVAVYLGLTRLR